ncbi:hypothetical protein CCP1ISM_250016 [Azospirillaceae bacterium]
MKTKVKIISDIDIVKLEEKTNTFLDTMKEEKSVITIQLSTDGAIFFNQIFYAIDEK